MFEFFEQLKLWFIENLQSLDPIYSYFALGLASYIENVFPPAPGDVITVFAASLVGAGYLSFFPVVISSTVGSVLGFMTYYYIGKRLGKKFFYKSEWKLFSKNAFLIAENWFHKHGYGIILANRFLSGARSVISIFCGFSELDDKKVWIYSSISAFIWNIILIIVGQTLGKNWKEVEIYLQQYFQFVVAAGLLILLFFLIKNYRKKQSLKKNNSNNL